MGHRIKKVVATLLLVLCLPIVTVSEKFCGETLGVGRYGDVIPDSRMKASSEDPYYPASSGRLKDSGWAPRGKDKDPYPYLEIDLINLYLVCGFKIQGCSDFNGGPAWVTRYRVQVSPEKRFWDSWNYIKPEFYGGKSAKEIVYSKAEERKVGRYVRILPVAFKNRACVKVEVFGQLYMSKKVPVFVLEIEKLMSYTRGRVKKVEDTFVTVEANGRIKEHSFLPQHAQVIPLIQPLKTELKVDACVLAPQGKVRYMSGRVHEVKDTHYNVEWLIDVKNNAKKMNNLHPYKIRELYVVFSAWCKKVPFAGRVTHLPSKYTLCLGNIVRVDSRLVFQTKQDQKLTRISYKKKHRPPVSDYVSSQPVKPSEVTPGKTVLFYEEINGCLTKGKVTSFNKYNKMYMINGKLRKGTEVRYSEKHDFEQCGKLEKHCHDSRIPFKVNRRRCPYLQTWDGKKCKDEDECKTGFAACGMHATCKNTPGFYECLCPRGFESSNPRTEKCQDIDECKKKVCHKDAICHNAPGSFKCHCKKGYNGDGHKSCVEIDECKITANKLKCEKFKNAMCRNTPGSFHCECKSGFHGPVENCKELNECTSNKHKCSPYAHCTNTVGSYKCKCKKDFSGDGHNCKYTKKCDKRLKSDKCHLNSKCIDIPGGSKCQCKEGYSGDGIKSCKNINECKTGVHKCAMHSMCIDTIGSYSCRCRKGFTGDGRKECKPLPACVRKFPDCDLSKATCDKDEKGEFNCRCKPGYTNNSNERCADIDECSTGVCSKDSDCVNTEGSYSCSCKTGFQGNGSICSDVDECKNEAACAANAKCANTKGSFKCACNEGFSGNPYNTCKDVDECKLINCGYGQNCTNTQGSYVCSCAKGFRPDVKPGSCKDVDECATISSPCGTYNYLSCENEPGTYSCRCKMGYSFHIRERKCKDINECKKKSACAKNAECTNAEGSYSCICAKGYSGDGLNFCDVNGSPPSEAVKAWNLLLASLSTVLVLLL